MFFPKRKAAGFIPAVFLTLKTVLLICAKYIMETAYKIPIIRSEHHTRSNAIIAFITL